MSETLDELLQLIDSRINASSFEQIDFDTLEVLTNAAKSELSNRFVHLVESHKNQINKYTMAQRIGYLERLLNLHKLHMRMPEVKIITSDAEELTPTFVLAKDDRDRVVLLCSQMRNIVFASEVFDQPHRRRLLNRIAAIEKQIEQPKGMLDVILGGVSDIGETLGKFGGDIKPLTNRMAEVKQITRAGSKEYEQLPAPEERKLLPKPSDEEKAEGK